MSNVDVVVVGAGFGGLGMVRRLVADGWDVQGFEAADGVGGTWYWNRYPGARCDVESVEYSFSFDDDLQQEWEWTERYASQPEILRYLEHVADRYDLRRHFRFGTRVVGAAFDEAASRWTVEADDGSVTTARFVVFATGCLSAANVPDIPGLDRFAGEVFHTGRWPTEPVSFDGKRVGVIGTGSSGVQAIPVIAAEAAELVVFQRTATYTVPARNAPLDPAEQEAVKKEYDEIRAAARMMPMGFGARSPQTQPSALAVEPDERVREYESRWNVGGLTFLATYADLMLDPNANATAADFVREKIRSIVADPDTADRLVPEQVIGCKRLCLDTGYYETFNRPNVRLVDLRATPIEEITATGVRVGDEEVALDTLVLATGFDAMTGALERIDVRGRDGVALKDTWSAGPRTYLGLGVPGFPNMFIVTGPGSPSVLTNMVVAIEQHVDWIAGCLDDMRTQDLHTIEATGEAADQWVAYVNAVGGFTLFATCNSWYLGANVPGKPRVFMPLPGFPPYAEHCTHVARNGYEGFVTA